MQVGELKLDHTNLELKHDENAIRMTPKPFSLLEHLAERAGRVVPREDLMSTLWPGRVVSDAALGSAVREVRRALKALSVADAIRIDVVRGRGYRLSTPATRSAPGASVVQPKESDAMGLVGRVEELATLERALDRASTGAPRVVFLSGPAGIGKTRLAAELERIAAEKGCRTLRGRCIEGQRVDFSVWADLVRDFARSEDPVFVRATLQAVTPELPHALPSLRALAPKSGELPMDPELARLALIDAFLGLLGRIARHEPCVYVLEDLHWADCASRQLLQALASQRGTDRMLVVATYRDDEPELGGPIESMLFDLERRNAAERLRLAPLSADDSKRLLASLGPGLPAAGREQELLRIAGGNPFFLGELYRHATESASDRDLPDGIECLVVRRLESRSPSARSVLEAASVIGFAFEAHRTTALAGDDGSGLDELVTAGLVRPSRRRGLYRFTHALHQETVYANLPPVRRAQLHLRVAQGLERDAGPSVRDSPELSTIAHHYDRAAELGDFEKAHRYRVLAGEAATQRFAFEEATLHFVRAMELLDSLPISTGASFATEEARCDLWSMLARVARFAGDGATCDRALQAALRLARELEDPTHLAQCVTSAPFVSWEDRRLTELHEEALSRLDREPTPLRGMLLASLAQRLAHTGGTAHRQRALADEALAITAGSEHPRARQYVLEACSFALPGFEDVDERTRWADEMIALGRSERAPIAEAQGHVYRWSVELNRGRLSDAVDELDAIEEICRRYPGPWMLLSRNALRWVRFFVDGQLQRAEEHAFEAFDILGSSAHPHAMMIFGMQLALLRREQGRLSELGSVIDGMTKPSSSLAWIHDVVASDLGDPDALPRLLRDTFEAAGGPLLHTSPASKTSGMYWLAELSERWSDASSAAAIARELEAGRGSWAILGAAAFATLGSVHRAFGLLQLARDRPEEAVPELEIALASHQQPGATLLRLWTTFDLARALRRRGRSGDRDRAKTLLEEVEREAAKRDLARLGQHVATLRAG